MTALFENIQVALPEMVLLITACMVILLDLFLPKASSRRLSCFISCIGLLIAALLAACALGAFKMLAFGGLYIVDDMASLMKIFICLSVFFTYLYSRTYLDDRKIPAADFYVLGLFSTLGMILLVCAHSMLTMYMGLELSSLPVYAMTAIRRTDGDSSESAIKYFVMGAIASGLLLYGLSLVYAATGALNLTDIATAIAAQGTEHHLLLVFALVFVLAGLAFKLAAAPFHMWAPDVYQGAPTPVTLFISTAPKIAALGMTFRLLTLALPDLLLQWQQIVLVLALLSVGLGNVVAVVQTNIKRLLAYSAIAHAGYTLFGLLAGTAEGYSAALYYMLVYSLMSAAAFGLLILLSQRGVEVESLSDLKGLSQRSPWLAFMMLLVMFSMAGVPPTVGFFTKLLVLKALIDAHMIVVAVLGLLFTVVGAFYYLRIVKFMYFDEPADTGTLTFSRLAIVLYSVNCLSLLYLGILPSGLIALCIQAFS